MNEEGKHRSAAIGPAPISGVAALKSKVVPGLLLFAVYLATARLALVAGPISGGSSLFWPPAGIAMAALLLRGVSLWPAVAVASFSSAFWYGGSVWVALGVALASTMEAVWTALILRRLGFRSRLQRVRDVLLLAGIGAGCCAAISAAIGVTSYWLGDIFPAAACLKAFFGWWLGDATSILLLTPILLVWSKPPRLLSTRAGWIELCILLLAVTAASIYVFNQWFDLGLTYRLVKLFIVAPLFIWAALRFGLYGTTVASGIAAILGGIGLMNGGGPFQGASLASNLIYLQTLYCLGSIFILALAAAVSEMQKSLFVLRIGRERARKVAADLRAMFDHSGAAHTVLDPVEMRFTRVNQRFCQMVGYTREELLHESFMIFTLPDERDWRVSHFQSLVRGEIQELRVERRLPRKDGSVIWADISSTVLHDTAGRPLKVFSVLYDITARKNAEAALVKAKDAAEAATRAKNEFLGNVSHELKTPLGAMLGFSEFLLDPSQTAADRVSCVLTIKRNGDLLTRMIDDVLDLSRLELEQMDIAKVWVSLEALVEDMLMLLRYRAEDKGLRLTVCSAGPVPVKVMTDPVRLRQILQHLIENAIKFSAKGEISLVIRHLAGVDGGLSRLEFTVTDQGQGITPEAITRLFQPFTQVDSSTTRRFGGAGIGLFFAKKLALAMQGDLVLLASSPGFGSTFVLTVAVEAEPPCLVISPKAQAPIVVPAARVVETPLQNRRILLVEDSVDNQILIRRILSRAGATVDLACNGAEGITMATSSNYDLVLMDLQMPMVDGYEATTELRRRGYLLPIVAITAHAMKDNEAMALTNGFNDFLTKPVQSELMVARIARRIAVFAAQRGDGSS
ncbi:MAG: response regulator [Proteobacteria bacterium]|nr:response regulator [Pseudomonadota bacterium]